jgi:5'-AMP-activated protein kinase catalytic alpha subunit
MLRKKNMNVQIKREITLMKMIHHKHVIEIKDVLATAKNIFIVLELVTGGEIFDKIVESKRFNEEKARFYFKQLVDGMECCHSQGVVHRDLKPENLLLDSEGNMKITDFGMANLYMGDANASAEQRTELLHTTCGTPNYVAPEVLTSQGYDGQKADIWSMGVILYVFLAGYLPFEEGTTAALFRKIQAADFQYPSFFTNGARSLISSILVVDPANRLTLAKIKDHPWMKGSNGASSSKDRSSKDRSKSSDSTTAAQAALNSASAPAPAPAPPAPAAQRDPEPVKPRTQEPPASSGCKCIIS